MHTDDLLGLPARPYEVSRLEDFGFGATIAAIAAAVLVSSAPLAEPVLTHSRGMLALAITAAQRLISL